MGIGIEYTPDLWECGYSSLQIYGNLDRVDSRFMGMWIECTPSLWKFG